MIDNNIVSENNFVSKIRSDKLLAKKLIPYQCFIQRLYIIIRNL